MQILKTGKPLGIVCAASELSAEALAILSPELDAPSFLDRLVAEQNFADAISFLAHALPAREAVWWAWLCARDSVGDAPSPAVAGALAAIHAWIADPSDTHRRGALDAAQPAGFTSAVGCTALAVFLTGETLGPATAPPAPPGEYAAAKAIAGAIHLAATTEPVPDVTQRYETFMQRGLELAKRIQLWTPPSTAGAR